MNTGLIAVRYATALLSYANENQCADRVYVEAKSILQCYSQLAELRTTLDNPVLSKAEKRRFIGLAAGGNATKTLLQFVDLLLTNNRESFLQSIMLRFAELYRKQNNIHVAKLTTATPADSKTEKRLLGLIETQTGGTVELEKLIDPSILGGFQFEVDFVRMDASLSGQLQRIKAEYRDKNKRSVQTMTH